jgi:hypothetical protein
MRRNGAVYMEGGRPCPSARARRRALSDGVAFSPEKDANRRCPPFLSEALAAKLGRQGAAEQAMLVAQPIRLRQTLLSQDR